MGRTTFSSTVNLTVPSPYRSLALARASKSEANSLPTGMHAPAQKSPGCFCAWTPKISLLSNVPAWSTATVRCRAPPAGFDSISSATASLAASTPTRSTSHITRAFCLSPRSPFSLNHSRKALTKSTTKASGTKVSKGIDVAQRFIDRYPPTNTFHPLAPVLGSTAASNARSLMCECTKSSLDAENDTLNLRGRLQSSSFPLPLLVIMSSTAWAKGRVSQSSKGSMPAMGEPVICLVKGEGGRMGSWGGKRG